MCEQGSEQWSNRHRRSPGARWLLKSAILLALTGGSAARTAQALTPTQPLASYGRQSWQTDSGLPQSTVHAILQTRDGFLWIATEGGLARYDGADFRVFNPANTPALTSSLINDLAEDAAGNLWIATADGLVERPAGEPASGSALRRYTTADGLPSNVVRALRELSSHEQPGSLIVLTAAGIALRTEGARAFHPVQGLAGDIPPTLIQADPQGTLWVAVPNGTVRTLAPGSTTSRFAFSLPPSIGEVQAIAIESSVSTPTKTLLWLGGTNGLAQLSAGLPPRSIHLAPRTSVTALLAAPGGTLWIGTNQGVERYREASAGQDAEEIPGGDVGPAAEPLGRILKLDRDRRGAIWVAGELGLSRIDDPATTPRLEAPLNLPGILAITEDREGDLWLGSDTDGLTVLREQAVHTLTRADGLSDDYIRSILQAANGTVWIGTNRGGLDRSVGQSPARSVGPGPGRSLGQSAPTVHGAPDSNLGSRIVPLEASSLEARQAGQVHQPTDRRPALTSNIILALADASPASRSRDSAAATTPALWIGTPDGLAHLDGRNLRTYTTADGLTDDFVRSLFTDTDGSLWVGTRNGLSHLVSGRFTNYSRLDGLGSELIGAVLRTQPRGGHPGTLWVGTLGGLSRFDGTGFKTFTHADGLAGDAITTLAEDNSGALWIAANGAGLTRLKDGVFTAIDSKQAGLPLEIFSILEDAGRSQSLWLGTSQGIVRVSLATLNALAEHRPTGLEITHFGVADGMAISECSSGGHPAAWALEDGSLWFATRRGVATIRPGSGYENHTPPLVAIEEVVVNERVQTPRRASDPGSTSSLTDTGELTLAPGENRLAIHYAGLSFIAPAKVRFRYRLIGFDRDWVEAGARRSAYYTNLPPGRYRFEVMAANGDGVWSLSAATLSLRQRAHLYQTLWFYLLAAVIVAAVLIGLYRWRASEARRQYQLVLDERARIAREIHDTLAQGYVGVSVQLELVTRLLGRSSTSHVATPQPPSIEAAVAQLEATKAFVRASLAEARSSIWQLRAPAGDSDANSAQRQTLPERIATSIERLRREHPSNPAPALKLDVQGTARALDRRREDELVRIADEAVTNALRHSHATEIAVTLRYTGASLILCIADNGQGFSARAVPEGHFGLKGIRERAAAIGARIRVEANPDAGSRQPDAGAAQPALVPPALEQRPSGTMVEVCCSLDQERE